MFDMTPLNIITGFIVLLGIIAASAKKLGYPLFAKKGSNPSPSAVPIPVVPVPAISEKTSGCLHISEEALGKVAKIEEDYLKEKTHGLICSATISDLKLSFQKDLKEHTKEIKAAIKEANGGG